MNYGPPTNRRQTTRPTPEQERASYLRALRADVRRWSAVASDVRVPQAHRDDAAAYVAEAKAELEKVTT
jgi:hypothetical protein